MSINCTNCPEGAGRFGLSAPGAAALVERVVEQGQSAKKMMAETIGHHGSRPNGVGRLPSQVNCWNDHPCDGFRCDGLHDDLGDRGWLDDRRPHGDHHGFPRHVPQQELPPYGVLNSGGNPYVSAFCSSKGSSQGWASWHSIQRFRRGSVFKF